MLRGRNYPPFLPSIVTHAALGLSVAALVAAALRVASTLAPDGLARALAAAPLAVAAAVAEALGLGLAGLGGSSLALTAAALLTWVAARALTPCPAISMRGELRAWWSGRPARERALFGALAGAGLGWAIWQLRYPQIGFDSQLYHLPEIVLWVQGGHPGAVEKVLPGLPVGNYPLTNEVTVAWATGIARSFVPFMLWPWLTLVLTACASWAGLRALAVPRVARGAAVAALCSSPWLLAWQSHGTMTDPPALAWLVCAASLFALAQRQPRLLAPALLAAGLAVGVKSTTLPLALLVVVLGLWTLRRELRALAVPLAAALLGALAVGGVWYVRDLIEHGSPLWPIVAAPWGDPVPHWIQVVQTSFLERPAATVAHISSSYLDRMGGGLILLAGALLAPLAFHRRRTLAASAVTLLALLLWVRSPLTGVSRGAGSDEAVFSATRYLLPALAVGALALALAAAERRRASVLATVVLSAAAVLNLVQTLDLGSPSVPGVHLPLLAGGTVAGAIAAALITRPLRVRLPGVAVPLLALVAGSILALPARGFLARNAETRSLGSAPIIKRLVSDPGYRDGDDPVATSTFFIGALAGDHLEHRLENVPLGESCPRIAARARTGWLVVYRLPGPLDGAPPLQVRRCLPTTRPVLQERGYLVYRPQ